MPLLKAEFSVDYRLFGTSEWKVFSYNFDIADYAVREASKKVDYVYDWHRFICLIQTLFTVRSRVEPVKGNDFLRTGSLCHMTLTVSDVLQQASSAALMYEVLADQALWAVCGRTAGKELIIFIRKLRLNRTWSYLFPTGVFSMEGSSKHSVTLDVMPLVCGFLPLPAVRLSRYIPAEQKPKGTKSWLSSVWCNIEYYIVDFIDGNRKADLAAASLPRLEPFSAGQVYNWSKAQQVHVLAAPSNNGSTSFDISTSWIIHGIKTLKPQVKFGVCIHHVDQV